MDYKGRMQAFQELIDRNNLDAVFLTRRCMLGFFTGAFVPWSSALFVPATGEPVLITLDIDAGRVKNDSYLKNIRVWKFGTANNTCHNMALLIKEKGLERGRIGFEMETAEAQGVLTAFEYLYIMEQCPNIEAVNVLKMVNDILVPKTDEEIELLRRAAEAADNGMRLAFEKTCIGMTEVEIAGWADLGARQCGHTFNWCVTGTEVGSGYRNAFDYGWTCSPGLKRVQHGDIITIDLHTMYGLYLSDLCLNMIIGEPSPVQRKLADDWKLLVDHLLSLLKPGAVGRDITMSVLDKAKEIGVQDIIVEHFGHGLGVDCRIPPVINMESANILEDGMAMVAVLQLANPGVGGMRLELPVLVTANGADPLCKTPLELYIKKV